MILLILASVSISVITNTSILDKTQEAKDKAEERQREEEQATREYMQTLEGQIMVNNVANEP